MLVRVGLLIVLISLCACKASTPVNAEKPVDTTTTKPFQITPSSGPIGTEVQITGLLADTVHTISINGLSIPTLYENDPSATSAVIPSGATTGFVTVNKDGPQSTDPIFTVTGSGSIFTYTGISISLTGAFGNITEIFSGLDTTEDSTFALRASNRGVRWTKTSRSISGNTIQLQDTIARIDGLQTGSALVSITLDTITRTISHLVYQDNFWANTEITIAHNNFIDIKNIPGYTSQPDGSIVATLRGSDIFQHISEITESFQGNGFDLGYNSQTCHFLLNRFLSCSDNAVLTVTLWP